MVLLERLAQACLDADTGMSLGPTWTEDQGGARITGWAIEIGLDGDTEAPRLVVHAPTIEEGCAKALDGLSIVMRKRKAMGV